MYKSYLPLNLQFFAEGGGDGGNDGDGKPSYDDLAKQLATVQAQLAKMTSAKDNATTQAAEFKKQLRELMDDKQREEADRKDADEANQKELNDLRAEVNRMKAVNKYRKMGMDEALAAETAEAEISGDSDKVTECFEKHIKAVKANEYQRFLDERKDPNAGRGKDETDPAVEIAKKVGGRSHNADVDILNKYKF